MKSFIQYSADTHFPIQNLPYGIFKPKPDGAPRAGVAIGDFILDLSVLEDKGMLKNSSSEKNLFNRSSLNLFMSRDKNVWKEIRSRLQSLLDENNPELRDNKELRQEAFIPMSDAIMCKPVEIGDYTDFYSSREHATNVGIMFRGKENALMPNWLHLPVGYHGRSSSIVISGTDIIRPKGQMKPADAETPVFGASKLMDFELEMGFFIGKGNELGTSISVEEAEEHIFGMVIVNDWSARDIQAWEYVPLGPFLGKNFATSISPWVVTLDALEPFRCSGPKPEFEPLPYLQSKGNKAFDIKLDVFIEAHGWPEPYKVSHSNFKFLYWSMAQQLAHHTVNGCNIQTGDLLASGTISGDTKESRGSMLELTWRGAEPIKLPNGEERKFINDGDTVIMSAYCEGDGYKIGFGEVSGKILPAKQ
ncbi:MAG: fumarylacetoacetase [Ignavibacteria bacterium]|nr:fumarylacetoacetase [Ignavibacteria bacterium]